MPPKIPNGWIKTTLGEIAYPSRERAMPTDLPDMPYVGLEHIEPQTMRLLTHGYAREARSASVQFSKGDVLYGKMRPYLNKVWVAEFDGICSAEFLVFPRLEGLNSEFLALRLNSDDFVTFASGQVSGERPRVDFEKLARFPILLPPTREQDAIVAKLSAALLRVGQAEAAARRARERLNRYRRAVLKVNGRQAPARARARYLIAELRGYSRWGVDSILRATESLSPEEFDGKTEECAGRSRSCGGPRE